MSLTWSFWVDGRPRPKGSLIPIPRKHAVPIATKKGFYYRCPQDIFLGDQNKHDLRRWMNAVKWAGEEAGAPRQPLDGPWRAELVFHFRAPGKPMHPRWAIGHDADGKQCGDTDKLIRAILDALQGVFWTNDQRVGDVHGQKVYGPKEGMQVELEYLGDAEQLSLVDPVTFK